MPSELITTVTDGNFQTEVMESQIPVLVDFWAPWCGPCLALAPVLEKVAAARKGKVKICKVDVEENPTLAAKFGIRNIPFLVLIVDGEKVGDIVGNQPEKKILEAVDKLKSKHENSDDNKEDADKKDKESKEDEKSSDER